MTIEERKQVQNNSNSKFIVAIATTYIVTTAIYYTWLVLLDYAFPQALFPFSLNDIWQIEGDLLDWLTLGLPLFAWVIVGGSMYVLSNSNSTRQNARPVQCFCGRLYISVLTGFFEELLYRWIYFYLAIIASVT